MTSSKGGDRSLGRTVAEGVFHLHVSERVSCPEGHVPSRRGDGEMPGGHHLMFSLCIISYFLSCLSTFGAERTRHFMLSKVGDTVVLPYPVSRKHASEAMSVFRSNPFPRKRIVIVREITRQWRLQSDDARPDVDREPIRSPSPVHITG